MGKKEARIENSLDLNSKSNKFLEYFSDQVFEYSKKLDISSKEVLNAFLENRISELKNDFLPLGLKLLFFVSL